MAAKGRAFRAEFNLTVNKHIAERAKGAIVGGVNRGLQEMVRGAMRRSPVLTGHNRRNIRHEVDTERSDAAKQITATIFTTSGYGGWLETGTTKRSATPYIRPSVEENTPYLLDSIRSEMDKIR